MIYKLNKYIIMGLVILACLYIIRNIYSKKNLALNFKINKLSRYLRSGLIIALLWTLKLVLDDNIPQLGLTDNQLLVIIIIFLFILLVT